MAATTTAQSDQRNTALARFTFRETSSRAVPRTIGAARPPDRMMNSRYTRLRMTPTAATSATCSSGLFKRSGRNLPGCACLAVRLRPCTDITSSLHASDKPTRSQELTPCSIPRLGGSNKPARSPISPSKLPGGHRRNSLFAPLTRCLGGAILSLGCEKSTRHRRV